MNLKIKKAKSDRKEIFNYKDQDSLKKFKKVTSEPSRFTFIFSKNIPFKQQIKAWTKSLKGAIRLCLKKNQDKKEKAKIL